MRLNFLPQRYVDDFLVLELDSFLDIGRTCPSYESILLLHVTVCVLTISDLTLELGRSYQ